MSNNINRFQLPLSFLFEAAENCTVAKYKKWHKENPGTLNNLPSGLLLSAGGGLVLSALFGLTAYKNNGETKGTAFKLLTLASLAGGAIPSIYYLLNGVSLNGKSQEAEAFEKVRGTTAVERHRVNIDKTPELKTEVGSVPLEMWDPKVHGDGYLFRNSGTAVGIQVISHKEFDEKLKAIKENPDLNDMVSSAREDVIDVSLPHYRYKAKVKDHELDILIPQVYADHRESSVEKILKRIDLSLSAIPTSLVSLVKKIQLHISDSPSGEAEMKAMEDGSINVYHGNFNYQEPELPPTDAEKEREAVLFSLPNKDDLRIGDGGTTNCILHHEIGHLIEYYIRDNFANAQVPNGIFPKDSELQGKELSINEHFARSAMPDELIFPNDPELREKAMECLKQLPKDKQRTEFDSNDAWLNIAKADNTFLSIYGLAPNEDFPETVGAFLKAITWDKLGTLKEQIPNRYAFLLHCCKCIEDLNTAAKTQTA